MVALSHIRVGLSHLDFRRGVPPVAVFFLLAVDISSLRRPLRTCSAFAWHWLRSPQVLPLPVPSLPLSSLGTAFYNTEYAFPAVRTPGFQFLKPLFVYLALVLESALWPWLTVGFLKPEAVIGSSMSVSVVLNIFCVQPKTLLLGNQRSFLKNKVATGAGCDTTNTFHSDPSSDSKRSALKSCSHYCTIRRWIHWVDIIASIHSPIWCKGSSCRRQKLSNKTRHSYKW